jgi:hypothetical protein
MNAHVFDILMNNEQMSDKVRVCCALLDEMSIRRLIVVEALRSLEAMAGQAILQIMAWSLCSVVYVKSGSHKLLVI